MDLNTGISLLGSGKAKIWVMISLDLGECRSPQQKRSHYASFSFNKVIKLIMEALQLLPITFMGSFTSVHTGFVGRYRDTLLLLLPGSFCSPQLVASVRAREGGAFQSGSSYACLAYWDQYYSWGSRKSVFSSPDSSQCNSPQA